MPEAVAHKPLTVAISSTALFDLSKSNQIYESQGLEAYRRYQIEQEDSILEPGDGYDLVKKILNWSYKIKLKDGLKNTYDWITSETKKTGSNLNRFTKSY